MSSPSVAVVCWDLGHNAFARAHGLAEMLAAEHEVEIVGSHFPPYGADVWQPLRDTPIPVRRYPGDRFPGYFETMERMAADLTADVVYVVKPRLPGLGVGFLARCDERSRLVVDCDDLELSFVGGSRGVDPAELATLQGHPDFLRPEGRIWTGFCEWAVRFADAVTVANVPLAARYGGRVIPHARDEHVFDPDLHDRDEARASLGLARGDRVVLFAGTPRRHKGIQQVAAALDRIGDVRNRLCLFATPELEDIEPMLAGLEQWVRPIPPQPFSRLPEVLSAADAICVLQDPESESARWQTPAKITDALAMGIPCLASPAAPLLPLIDEGGLIPVGSDDLAEQLEIILNDPARRAEQSRRGRDLFLRRFSYSVVRPRLESVVRDVAVASRTCSADLASVVSFQRSLFKGSPKTAGRQTAATDAQLVHATLRSVLSGPTGPIAVVSHGDDDLIRFDDRVGWHFPQGHDGAYAGHHPKDSDAAIRYLEDVRHRGARYLVIPASSAWWLDYYVGFRDHLATAYQLIEPGDGIRAVVDLCSMRAHEGELS